MLKSFSIYTVALIVDKAIGFLLLPLFTFYLNKSDFGSLSLLNTIFTFTLPLITLGAQGSVSVFYFQDETKSRYPSYFSSALVPSLLTALLILICVIAANGFIKDQLNLPPIWVVVIPIFAFFSFFNSMLLVDCQIKSKPILYVLFSLINSLLTVLISLFLVVELKMGYEGRLYGQYVTILIIFACSLAFLAKKKTLIKNINLQYCRDALKFGLPLLPHTVGFMVINMSDRFFINHFLGKEILGVYNIGFLMGSVISIVSSAFSTSIVPFSYDLFSQNTIQSKEKVVKVYWLFIFGLLILFVSLIGLSPFLFKYFIDKKFNEGQLFVKWIAIGYVFQALYLLFANTIFYLKKTKVFLYCSFFNVTSNLLLNYFFVKFFGAVGAAYAFAISSLLFLLVIGTISNRFFPLPWKSFFKRKINEEVNN